METPSDYLPEKQFYTYRKTKTHKESVYFRWNWVNFINKHYTRATEAAYDEVMDKKVCKKIFQQRPSLVLNIDNEYMSLLMMDELRRYYAHSNVDMPQRHYFNRFARDFKQWTLKYFDQAHYTCPLYASSSDGNSFPGQYVGQYGAYDAIKHIYQRNPSMAHLVKENSLFISDKYFASDLEKGITALRTEWRAAQGIDEKATVIFFSPGNEKEEA